MFKNYIPTDEVLVVTACINPNKTQDVIIRDVQERFIQYLSSLIAWIKLTNIKTIVFCENTNTTYDFSELKALAAAEGKTLETLIFDGNQKSQKYGKGYGEGEIVKYAIKNSHYLTDSTNFYKITGRLFVPDFNQLQQSHEDLSNVFNTGPFDLPKDHPWVIMDSQKPFTLSDFAREALRFFYVFFGRGRGRVPHKYTNLVSTIFYKSNVAFFKKSLMDSYKRVNESKSYSLEHVFYEDLERKKFSHFLTEVEFLGVCAGTGESYSNQDYPKDIKRLAESLCLSHIGSVDTM